MRMGLMSRCAITVALVLTGWHTYAAADLNAQYRLNVPPLPVFEALKEFAAQTNLQVVYYSEVAQGIDSPGAVGQLTAGDALGKILGGTGLTFQFLNDRTIAIRIAGTAGQSDRTQTPSAPQSLNNSQTPSPDTAKKAGWFDRFRLAQAESSTSASPSATSAAEEKIARASDDDVIELGEVVVTGTHIRGVGVSTGSKVTVIDRAEIDRSGFATTQDILTSLPQVFQGGASEDARIGGSAGSNPFSGVGVDLRGLGTAATLTLVNGRRLPLAGAANFVDISNIPATAIERIEVLPDGASAIYGSDAIAGVVNVILREDYAGTETRARIGDASEGSLREYQLGQVFGKSWGTGNAFFSYEFYKRENLANEDRTYATSADLRPLGGDDFRLTTSNPGNIIDLFTGRPAFAIPEGQDGTALTPGDLLPGVTNFHNQWEAADLLPEQKRHGVLVTLRQQLGERTKLFAEGRYSKRDFRQRIGGFSSTFLVPPSNPFFVDPQGFGLVILSYNFLDDLGPNIFEGSVEDYSGVLGGTLELGRDWQVQLYGSYSEERSDRTTFNQVDATALAAALADPDPATAFNPFGDGSNTNPATIETIRSSIGNTLNSTVWSVNLKADGAVFRLPGGDVKLAVGSDYRRDEFDTLLGTTVFGKSEFLLEREVVALYGELFIPLFAKGNRRPGLESLIISAAGRFEGYSGASNDSTTNPKFGVTWSPLNGLNFRGSYGTSFKAPNLPDLDESLNVAIIFPFVDPSSPTGTTRSLLLAGNNKDLKNETATTWTVAVEVVPLFAPNLELDLTYFNIDYNDRIANPGNLNVVLIEEDRFASIIIRDPTQEQIDAICNSEEFLRLSDPASCRAPFPPIGAIIDGRLNNTARTKIEGLDLAVGYGFDAGGIGRFNFRLNGSYFLKFEEAFSPTSETIKIADTVHNPVDFRLRSSVTWSNAHGFSATAFVNYTGSYTDNVSSPERKVDSWTTADLTMSYSTGDRATDIRGDGTTFALSVHNLFDTDPPFVNNTIGLGYDPQNADPFGRYFSFSITKGW